jgi:hypothetical protein
MRAAWQDGYLLAAGVGLPDTRSVSVTLSPNVHVLSRVALARTARELRLFPHGLPIRLAFDRDPDVLGQVTALDVDLPDFTFGDIVLADVWSRWQLPQDGLDHEARLWRETVSPVVLTLQYGGIGTAAVLDVDATTLATTVTGGPGGEDLALDLTAPGVTMLADLVAILNVTPYSCTLAASALGTQATASGLMMVAGQDILTLPYGLPSAMRVDIALVLE